MPTSSPYPFLRPADILHNQRNIMPCRFTCFSLDAQVGVEQFDEVMRWPNRIERFRSLPRHRSIAWLLAWRRGNDYSSIFQLRSVDTANIAENERSGVSSCSVVVFFDVICGDLVIFRKELFCPPSQCAIEIMNYWLHTYFRFQPVGSSRWCSRFV